MQVPETDVTWTYSLLNASESRASARTATPMQNAAELVGIDGTNNGGLQPFPGFREFYRFEPDTATGWSGSNPYLDTGTGLSIAHRSRVVDFWSFSVIAGTSTRVFGFVYLVRRPSDLATPACNNFYDLLIAYNAPNSGSNSSIQPQTYSGIWKTEVLTEGIAAADASVLADGGKAVMSVETTGRAVYVFRRGQAPLVIYFKVVSPTSTTMTKLTAGPGKRVGSGPYINGASPPVEADFPTTLSSVNGHLASSFPDPTNSSNPPGSVVFCRFPTTGSPANGSAGAGPFSVSNLGTAAVLEEGSYSFAVQFEDSRSGRKSQICNNVNMTWTGSSKRLFLDGIYDSSKFDTLNVYRSVRTNAAGGAFTNGVLQLEAQITLSSYQVTDLPMRTGQTLVTGPDISYFRYAYQLGDSALVMQDVFLDKPSYTTTMPKGGAGALLDGTMLVGNISDGSSDLTGTGETRWSASGTDSPELFTATGVYKPQNIGDAVTCFRRTGQIMAGFTRNGIQVFSKQNGFIRVLGAHQGYGITGPYAAVTVGPVTYYLNYRGLKALYPDGRLDDVQSINQVVTDVWYQETTGAQELSKVSLAFDPSTLCMYILNPSREQAVQMWFATGVVSELRDMSFGKVTQGWWEDTDGQLVPRAMFLFNAPYPDAVTNSNFRPAVFMPSRNYNDKNFTPTKPAIGMLDINLDRCPSATITTVEPDPPTNILQYNSSCTRVGHIVTEVAASNISTDITKTFRLIGSWVYLLSPVSNPTSVVKHRVVDASATTIKLDGGFYGSGMKWVLDPVYVKWMGSPLRLSEAKDEDFVVRQPTSMGVVFSEFETGTSAPSTMYWVGSLYRNEDSDPILSYVPTKPDGTVVNDSVQVGDTPHWVAFGKHSYLGQWFFPSFETFLPNVRYRLVGAQVKGRMLPTDRTRRTY
jgi:hypothetical protein